MALWDTLVEYSIWIGNSDSSSVRLRSGAITLYALAVSEIVQDPDLVRLETLEGLLDVLSPHAPEEEDVHLKTVSQVVPGSHLKCTVW